MKEKKKKKVKFYLGSCLDLTHRVNSLRESVKPQQLFTGSQMTHTALV